MKRTLGLLLILLLTLGQSLAGAELTAELSAELRLFPESPIDVDQKHNNGSLAIEAELFQQINDAASFLFQPFYRQDSSNAERSHGDVRSCSLLYAPEPWELTIGIDKVFWGVTEFVHLVDIINQTDLLEGIDGEDKLGQPMVRLRIEEDWGMLDSFLLPYFRVRSFPGKEDRLRGPIAVDGTDCEFASGAEEYHPDLAFRYSRFLGDWDFGIYQFFGTSREPLFLAGQSTTSLTPYYEQIVQTGLDLQLTAGKWLCKLEALSRSSSGDDGLAATTGFEYSFRQIPGTTIELGIIGEYVFDDRNIAEYTIYDNDLMAGVRLSFNDQGSTELLVGLIQDTENDSTALSFELSHRINDVLAIEITGALLGQLASNDPAAAYNQDSFTRVVATCYF